METVSDFSFSKYLISDLVGYFLFYDQVQTKGPDPLCDTLSGQIHHFELMKGLVCQGEHLHDLCLYKVMKKKNTEIKERLRKLVL